MSKRTHILFWLLPVLALFGGCKKDALPKGMDPGYFKIYDDQTANNSYRTLDVQEMSDGGALVLAALNNSTIYLLRSNEKGEYLTSAQIGGGNVHPLPTLLRLNDTFYVGCMDEVGLFTRILQVDPNSCQTTTTAEFTNLLYPLAFSADGDAILLLSYDRYTYRSQLSRITLGGQTQWTLETNVNQDVETQLVNHLNGTGKRFPFFTANWNGKYVMNGFNNYSFSLLVFAAGSSFPEAIYNGSNYSSGASAMLPLEGGNAALARFSFGNSYFTPAFAPASGVVDLTDNITGFYVEEAEADSEFELGMVTVDDVPYLCFGYNITNGRVAIGFMDASGQLNARKYFGSGDNPFKLGNFRFTQDKGLLVAGTFYVAGSFPRPALFKLNEKELFELMGLKYE